MALKEVTVIQASLILAANKIEKLDHVWHSKQIKNETSSSKLT